jgi:hypothetical protein
MGIVVACGLEMLSFLSLSCVFLLDKFRSVEQFCGRCVN